jgi:hypothetical protein
LFMGREPNAYVDAIARLKVTIPRRLETESLVSPRRYFPKLGYRNVAPGPTIYALNSRSQVAHYCHGARIIEFLVPPSDSHVMRRII